MQIPFVDLVTDVDPDVAEQDMDFISLGSSSQFDVNAYQQLRDLCDDFETLHTDCNLIRLVIETTIETNTHVDGLSNYNEPTHMSSNQSIFSRRCINSHTKYCE